MVIVIGIVLAIIGVVLIFVRKSQQSKLLEIKATKTSTAKELADISKEISGELGQNGAFAQITEVKGVIECDRPLKSELAGAECVYYDSKVIREYEEDYYETDSKTNRREHKTRRNSETLTHNTQSVEFYVRDATGRVLVDPADANIDATENLDRFERGERAGGRFSFGGMEINLGSIVFGAGGQTRTLGYRFCESILPVGRKLYVLGEATDRAGELSIRKPLDKSGKFIISLKSEEELVRSTESAIAYLLYGGIALVAIGAIVAVVGIFVK
jgi:hypothetical protein